MRLFDRIGINFTRQMSAEHAVCWATRNSVKYVDIECDIAPNGMETFERKRRAALRDLVKSNGIHLGLHTLSAVNIAEFSPFVSEAVDLYLRSYIDLAADLNAEWVVVHGGYHFTADRDKRLAASLSRLKRTAEYAAERGVVLHLENLNREPERAEVHYLASSLEEMRLYFSELKYFNVFWSYTINHATLEPEGIEGFLDGMPFGLLKEVRLADNNGLYELHMQPGDGIIDFGSVFKSFEARGYNGHFVSGFGTPDDMLRGRDYMIEAARSAGVEVDQ
jgi:sugar phosphate isomerase/epimerase